MIALAAIVLVFGSVALYVVIATRSAGKSEPDTHAQAENARLIALLRGDGA